MNVQLPDRTKNHLETFLGDLDRVFAKGLTAVVLHGSAARGEYREGSSDVDLVVVLESDAPSELEAIGPSLRLARTSAGIEALLLLAREVPHAADVFPLLYEDIAREGIALRGENVFRAVTVTKEHRRLRIEQELREARMRLRKAIAELSSNNEGLAIELERKVKQLRSPIAAFLRGKGESPSSRLDPLFQEAAAHTKIAMPPLSSLREAPKKSAAGLVTLLDAILEEVDREGR